MQACFDKMKKTLESVGASVDDMVQINLFLRDIGNFRPARDVFHKHSRSGFPARMASTTDFVDWSCLCMLDGIAYKKGISEKS